MENTYKAGNSVRLSCQFMDYSNQATDPSLIKVKIYNQKYEVIHEESISEANKISIGEYYFNYAIPMELLNQKLYYEWYGEVGGSPSLNRGKFKVVFI